MHDPEKSLRAVASEVPTCDGLQHITDVDLRTSLSRLPDATAAPIDPFATRAHATAEAGASGQRFRILRPHARGGLGEVFVAEDLELHREVALKEIQSKYADDASSRTRFLLEAEVTGGLEHPGIVPVYGLGQYADGRPFYAMRFIKGDSLKDAIARFHGSNWRHREGERTVAFRELLKELDERPLQPSSDSSSERTIAGTALGTPQFMSPEQAAGRLDLVGPASDIYSLGATLYCVLTGRPPCTAVDTGQGRGEPRVRASSERFVVYGLL
jgi:serine/threonine protein kinase